MKQVVLSAIKRTKTGKETAKKLRKHGFIPAIIYGPGTEPIPIAIKFNEFERVMHRFKGEMLLFNLEIKNGETFNKQAILKDYQIHPVTDKVIHVDFLAIHEGKPISVDVPLEFIGRPVGIPKGGILEIHMHELTVECLPSQIPDKITVDISPLDLGDVLHVKNIKVPEGVRVLDDPEETVVTIVAEEKGEESEETEETQE
jgi:large subunit ribosomal protein L25